MVEPSFTPRAGDNRRFRSLNKSQSTSRGDCSLPSAARLARQASWRQGLAQVGSYLGVCLVVAGSAFVAKRMQPGPVLMALDEPPVRLVLATNDESAAPASAALNLPADTSADFPRDPLAITASDPVDWPNLAAAPELPVLPEGAVDIVTPARGYQRYFDGRPIKPVKTIWMTVTAYSPDHRSCPGTDDGITATNHSVWTNAMRMVAADTNLLPFGSLVSVPGYAEGDVVPVLDRGGAIKGKRLDVLYATHEIARVWGRRKIPVTVWGYADGKGSSPRGVKH